MRDDQRFEIQAAFDLLPHVVGCSWATIWFRMNKIKKPTREEFREKVTEYFKMLDPLVNVYPQDEKFEEIISYLVLFDPTLISCSLYHSIFTRDAVC